MKFSVAHWTQTQFLKPTNDHIKNAGGAHVVGDSSSPRWYVATIFVPKVLMNAPKLISPWQEHTKKLCLI
jgi:hypothetical protein